MSAERETASAGQCAAMNCGEPAAAAAAASASAACTAPPAVAVGGQGADRTAADHSAAANPHGTAAAVTVAATVTVRPFSRLAAVELQLIMRCCDQSTLLALARCSRFTLAAASSPFAWQLLSPINLQCDWPLLLSKSLLRHADIRVTWRLLSAAAMSADQVTALATLP